MRPERRSPPLSRKREAGPDRRGGREAAASSLALSHPIPVSRRPRPKEAPRENAFEREGNSVREVEQIIRASHDRQRDGDDLERERRRRPVFQPDRQVGKENHNS